MPGAKRYAVVDVSDIFKYDLSCLVQRSQCHIQRSMTMMVNMRFGKEMSCFLALDFVSKKTRSSKEKNETKSATRPAPRKRSEKFVVFVSSRLMVVFMCG